MTRLEITKLKDVVYENDENAFITISDVHDVCDRRRRADQGLGRGGVGARGEGPVQL